jgi:hypothetical protein
MSAATRRHALRLGGLAALAVVLLVAVSKAAEPAAGPDAELIASCDALVDWETRWETFCASRHTIEEEERTEPQEMALSEEYEALIDRIEKAAAPTTIAGAAAMARAAMATAQRTLDGELTPNTNGEWLALEAAQFFAGYVA